MLALVVSHSAADHLGGAEHSLLGVLDRWSQEEADLNLIIVGPTPSAAMTREVLQRGWRSIDLDMTGWAVHDVDGGSAQYRLREVRNAIATRQLIDLLNHERPDLVVTNTLMMPWGALAAAQAGVPHVWFVREFAERTQGFMFPDGREAALRDIGVLSSAVVANSHAVAAELQPYMPQREVTVVYPPVDLSVVRQRASDAATTEFRDPGALRVAVLGRVTRSKGQWRVIEALATTHEGEVEVLFIGGILDSRADDMLLRRAKQLGVAGRLRFLGERSNPFPAVAQAQLCIVPSEKEAFGRSTLECLALGKPVITTRAGAGAELVVDGSTGALVDADDFVAWSHALRRYIDDRGLAARQSDGARRRADDVMSGQHSLSVGIDVLRNAPNALAGQVPERWLDWFEELDSTASTGTQWLVLRVRLTRLVRIALRIIANPTKAIRRLWLVLRLP